MVEQLSRVPTTDFRGHVLVVDDDADVQQAAGLLLGRHGFHVSMAAQPAQLWSVLAGTPVPGPVDVILLDLNFSRGAVSGAEGFDCLAQIMAHDASAVVVVVTGHSGINIAVQAMRAGASDFVMKPWNNARLLATLEVALALRRRRLDDAQAPGGRAGAEAAGGDENLLLGESAAMDRVRALIRRAAPTQASVLIWGAAGTGKSLIARTLHRQSPRAGGPFVCVDLFALSSDEAAASLFGEVGAAGALAEARGGTLVLDEIAALAPPLQGRLLAALETGRLDVRLIATTRRPRRELGGGPIGRDGVRADLLFRLNTVEIAVPPLGARDGHGVGDARLLAEHFLRLFADRHGRPQKPLSPQAAEAITATTWPGEVRGLRQAMERCVIFSDGLVYEAADVHAQGMVPAGDPTAVDPSPSLADTERALVAAALNRAGFNVSHAAKALGLTRAALYRRMAKHGL
jgi:DNA-binding NtrC family response regulator